MGTPTKPKSGVTAEPEPATPKPRFFYSHATIMAELGISRRTLQRWLDDMEIDPLEFENSKKVFLTLPNLERLREYAIPMQSRNLEMAARYRHAIQTGDAKLLRRVRKDLGFAN